VSAGTGNVSLLARSNESDIANATSKAKAGKVGIGVSVAINVLDDHVTRAAVEDGAGFSGGANLEVLADSRHHVSTENKAGSAGGTLALSPAVSIAIVKDQTSARVGTGSAVTISGSASITAKEEMHASLESDGEAGGKNVVDRRGRRGQRRHHDHRRGPPPLADRDRRRHHRRATTEASSEAVAKSSAKGESDSGKKGDDQSKDQVQNNPNTQNKTDGDLPKSQDSTDTANSQSTSKSGESSGGVDIAASVSVNWVRHTNTANIGPSLTVNGSGAVKVSAENVVGATAKAIGVAFNLESDDSIGAGIGLNVVDSTNTASVGAHTSVTGAGHHRRGRDASGQAQRLHRVGPRAAGGKSTASVAGLGRDPVAPVQDDRLGRQGRDADLERGCRRQGDGVHRAPEPRARRRPLDERQRVAGAVVVNLLCSFDGLLCSLPGSSTQAYIDSGSGGDVTHVDAAKKISVTSKATLDPIQPETGLSEKLDDALPAVSSVAVGGAAGGGSAAVTGSVIVDVILLETKAYIGDFAQVNQVTKTANQSVEVSAEDDTTITNVAGALALNDGSAAVAVTITVEIVNKDVAAYIGEGAHVWAGPALASCGTCDIVVKAIANETLFELTVAGGAGTGAAVSGSILVVLLDELGDHSTSAYIDDNAVVHAGGKVEVSASDTANLDLPSGNIAIGTGSAGVGVSAAILVRTGKVDATIGNGAQVTGVAGGVKVSATQSEDVLLIAVSGAGGNSAGVAARPSST
jgi:hypothetical protein